MSGIINGISNEKQYLLGQFFFVSICQRCSVSPVNTHLYICKSTRNVFLKISSICKDIVPTMKLETPLCFFNFS